MAADGADSKLKVLVHGHSHVYWLDRFIHTDRPNGPVMQRNLALCDCDVVFLGIRGATVLSLHTGAVLRQVRHIDPDIVILHVGGNDIDNKSGPPPQLVGMRIYTLAQTLVQQGVGTVMVSQVVRRNRWRHFSHMEGTERVARINEFLVAACSGVKNVFMWKHRGMWPPERGLFRGDGVHFNDPGNFKFYKSIRGAILHAVKLYKEV